MLRHRTIGNIRWALALSTVLFLTGCEKTVSPIQPPGATIHRTLELQGPSNIAPGRTGSFRAFVVDSRNVRQDVTEAAQWNVVDSSILAVVRAGVLSGVRQGESVLTVAYPGVAVLSRSILVLEDGTFRIVGRVLEASWPVADVVVAVSSGVGTGLSATSDRAGQFRLYGVAGDIELIATHDDYKPATRAMRVTTHTTADIPVTPLRTPYPMAGSWKATFTVASDCSLPVDAGPRTYEVAVTQDVSEIKVAMPTDVCPGGCTAPLTGRVTDHSVSIELPFGDVVDGPWIQTRLPSGAIVTIAGTAGGVVVNDRFEGRLNGEIAYYTPGTPRQVLKCSRSDHGFQLSKQ